MFIINQDRDELYFIQKPYIIDGKIILYDNKTYFGINLYIDNVFLGTFDTIEEFMQEVYNINNNKNNIYIINDNCS